MKSTNQLLVLILSMCMLHACHKKKEHPIKHDYPKKPGYVSFDLLESTLKNKNQHQISMFGCNIALTKHSPEWHGDTLFRWSTKNQVLSKVPFGKKYDKKAKKHYYINKYYIASPPVFGKKKVDGKEQTLYDIGLVVPDQFIFDGVSPVQKIFLDYSILKPSFIKYIPIKFDASIDTSKIVHIPFKVECEDFPWLETDRIKNGQGASGIGSWTQEAPANQIFLPYYGENENEEILDCEVSILNDILLHYEIKFVLKTKDEYNNIKESLVDKINIKEYYSKFGLDSIEMRAIKRPDGVIPAGCQKPIASDGPYGE